MATTTHTGCSTESEETAGGLSPFTIRSFTAITAALCDAASYEDVVAALEAQGDVDLARAQAARVDAWCRAETAVARFLRVHPAGPEPLVETAWRIEALLSLHGMEEKGHLFELISDTMLVRTRVAAHAGAGSQIDSLLEAVIPWMYRAAMAHAVYLPDDGDVRDLDPDDVIAPGDVLVA